MAFNAPVCSSETPSATAFGCIDQRNLAQLLWRSCRKNSDQVTGNVQRSIAIKSFGANGLRAG